MKMNLSNDIIILLIFHNNHFTQQLYVHKVQHTIPNQISFQFTNDDCCSPSCLKHPSKKVSELKRVLH